MSVSTDYTTIPVATGSTLPTVETSKKADKASNFTHQLFASPLFRQVMGVIGYIATSLGAEYLTKKIEQFLEGKSIGEFPADKVAKAAMGVVTSAARDYIDVEFKPEPLPRNIYEGLVRFQKEAEYRQDVS